MPAQTRRGHELPQSGPALVRDREVVRRTQGAERAAERLGTFPSPLGLSGCQEIILGHKLTEQREEDSGSKGI